MISLFYLFKFHFIRLLLACFAAGWLAWQADCLTFTQMNHSSNVETSYLLHKYIALPLREHNCWWWSLSSQCTGALNPWDYLFARSNHVTLVFHSCSTFMKIYNHHITYWPWNTSQQALWRDECQFSFSLVYQFSVIQSEKQVKRRLTGDQEKSLGIYDFRSSYQLRRD